ncbi:MAG: hypothetical protein JM58_13195 [Peptococcaceae bacterium BICA1-8]|nr:MAG: hypothetical protein JM58_13195 [Peptococcaceae bacterium BICA1-8]
MVDDSKLNFYQSPETDTEDNSKKSSSAVEKKRGMRKLVSPWNHIVKTIAVTMALFQLYAAGIGTIDSMYVIAVHLGFVLALIFLIFPFGPKSDQEKPSIIDLILLVLGVGTSAYIVIFLTKITEQMGQPTTSDLVAGAIAIVVVLEAARRSIGKALPIVAISFIIYGLFGRSFPGVFQHVGYGIEDIVKILYLTDEGLFGTALDTSATYIILFILFGSIMSQIGMSHFLTNFALGVAGSTVGGPAKVATLASGLMGTVSGSVSANVATTGVMTIPLMKSVGYKPAYAGAVECVASAGGQIMPPVMGAAAFLMAQFLGVPYSTIIFAAAIPALLYYITVWTSVDLRARKRGLKTIPKDQVPPLRETFRKYGHLAIPLLALIYFLTIKRYNPIYSAWLAILFALGVSFIRPYTHLSLGKLADAFESGVKSALSVAIACASAGIVIGIISLTGFGLIISMNIVKLAFGSLILTLVFGMVASIILGMGLPTTACYIVTALTVAPALMNMGVVPLAAHLFVFYFAIMSTLTPPVALSSFVAAGLADASPIETGITGFRLAFAGFLIPYMIVFKPELMIVDTTATSTVYALVTSIIGVIMLAAVNEGYLFGELSTIQRIALGIGVVLLLLLGWQGDLIALPLIGVIWFMQKRKVNNKILENINFGGNVR